MRIFAFHTSRRTGITSRSFDNNLIDGSPAQVVEFLERLSTNSGGVDQARWRAEIGSMFCRRRGQSE